jgi:hypothetical protein
MRGITTSVLSPLLALHLPMEVALAQKAWRSAEQVRLPMPVKYLSHFHLHS